MTRFLLALPFTFLLGASYAGLVAPTPHGVSRRCWAAVGLGSAVVVGLVLRGAL